MPAVRVLIADDSGDVAAWMGILLRAHGYEVRTATGGREALRLGDEFEPQYVLLDIEMPDLDGYQTAQAMRTKSWGRHAILIATTGWSDPEDIAHARASGFDHHLVKPVQSDRLLALLAGKASASTTA